MNAYLQVPLKVFRSFWQVMLFVWIGITFLYDWVKCVLPLLFTFSASFMQQLSFFIASLMFTPFTWWQYFFFSLLPLWIMLPVLAVYILIFFFFTFSQLFMFV